MWPDISRRYPIPPHYPFMFSRILSLTVLPIKIQKFSQFLKKIPIWGFLRIFLKLWNFRDCAIDGAIEVSKIYIVFVKCLFLSDDTASYISRSQCFQFNSLFLIFPLFFIFFLYRTFLKTFFNPWDFQNSLVTMYFWLVYWSGL